MYTQTSIERYVFNKVSCRILIEEVWRQ